MFGRIKAKFKKDKRKSQLTENDNLPTEQTLFSTADDIPEDPPADTNDTAIVVAAIDLGTSYTGYAFSFQHDRNTMFTSAHGGKLVKDKVPTTMLLNPDETFHSFGYDAEEKYASLAESENHKDWFYFKSFKMDLYRKKCLKRETEIFDSEGRPMAAMKVFSMAIQHIKELAVDIICKSKDCIVHRDIKWMITIPAIWADSARQFMREAAVNAGIAWDRLHLVLEPEAASLFCKEQPSQKVAQSSNGGAARMERFPTGHKYILADLGGGTADICVHEIIAGGHLREIYRATGGALGGTNVDSEFRQFLIKMFGADILMKFKSEYMDNYFGLFSEFERKKGGFTGKTEHVVLNIPASLTELIKDELGMTIGEIIPNTSFQTFLEFKPRQNKLIINRSLMEKFFEPSLEGIVNIFKDILQETHEQCIKTLILVGGYSESPYLREIIQSKIIGITVILEPEARLAVLKGAVLMGYTPRTIQERRAQFTYGFAVMNKFREGVHPASLKRISDGKVCCDNVFRKQIEKGQTLIYEQVFKSESVSSHEMTNSKYQNSVTQLFKSNRVNPEYCTEAEECTMIGEIVMNSPHGGWPAMVRYETNLIVGESEFTVKVFDKTTGAEYEAKIDFL